jgi:hypothetical protein
MVNACTASERRGKKGIIMLRSDEQMAVRDAKTCEIKQAFERAQVGVVHHSHPDAPHSSIVAYLSYGYGWQRQVIVTVEDNGDCRVFMSRLYEVPGGKTGADIVIGKVPLLFNLSGTTPDLGDVLVRRVREASITDSERMSTKLIEQPNPPVPLSDLRSLGDLIDAYEKQNFCKPYSDLLIQVLKKIGRVNHRGEDWFLEVGGHVCHTETAPESKPIVGPDGQAVVHTDASHIRLDPFLESESGMD